MDTSNAKMHFEQAIEIAKAENNQALEQIARGMIDMMKSIKAELVQHRKMLEKAVAQTR